MAVSFSLVITIGILGAFCTAISAYIMGRRVEEARQVWGNLIQASRSWGLRVLDYIATPDVPANALADIYDTKQILIYRHIAYINTLRIQLSDSADRTPMEFPPKTDPVPAFNPVELDKELSLFLNDDEVEFFVRQQNPATQIIKCQSQQLQKLRASGLLSNGHHIDMQRLLSELYAHQGTAERLRSVPPLPVQYACFSAVLVPFFILILPFGLLAETGPPGHWQVWLTVPIHTVVAWVLYALKEMGNQPENPFVACFHDRSVNTVCRSIEIDLREMLGEMTISQLTQVKNVTP